ncbi:MAG TPA: pantetheine-phosphate adenylyltransferase [Armatimonadota bacterium]|nr:pantetheine-phosphate adenylyltransferase [Armatimonadota bacterium]
MRIGIYPGSFDPVTNGHLDIVERASRLFDELRVAVGANPSKTTLFSVEERVNLLREVCAPFENVQVDRFDGLLVEYALSQNACAVVKGLRAISDFEYEFQQTQINRRLAADLDTVFVMTSTDYSYLSSSIVKEIVRYGGAIAGLVPDVVDRALRHKLKMGRD